MIHTYREKEKKITVTKLGKGNYKAVSKEEPNAIAGYGINLYKAVVDFTTKNELNPKEYEIVFL